VRLEGLGQLKNPMASSGVETATFRLVAHVLNNSHKYFDFFVNELVGLFIADSIHFQ
jgi:hypothetical protein